MGTVDFLSHFQKSSQRWLGSAEILLPVAFLFVVSHWENFYLKGNKILFRFDDDHHQFTTEQTQQRLSKSIFLLMLLLTAIILLVCEARKSKGWVPKNIFGKQQTSWTSRRLSELYDDSTIFPKVDIKILPEFECYGSQNEIKYDANEKERTFAKIISQNDALLASGYRLNLKKLFGEYWEFAQNFRVSPFQQRAAQLSSDLFAANGVTFPDHHEVSSMCATIYPTVTCPEKLFHATALFSLEYVLNNAATVKETIVDICPEKILKLRKLLEETNQFMKKSSASGKNKAVEPPPNSNFVHKLTKIIQDAMNKNQPPAEWSQKLPHLLLQEREEYLSVRNPTNMRDFKRVCNFSSAMPLTTFLIEYAIGHHISYKSLDLDTKKKLSRVHWLVNNLGFGVNDLISYQREIIKLRRNFNWIFVLMLDRGLSLTEAIEFAAQKLNTIFTEYRSLMEVLRREDKIGSKYLDALDDFVRGCLAWQLVCTDRYKSSKSILDFS